MGAVSGVYLHDRECFDTLIQSTFHLQHRGTQSSAIHTSKAKSDLIKNRSGEIKKAFEEEDRRDFRGNYGIGNLSGGNTELIELSSSIGDFSLAYDGKLMNSEELRKKLKEDGESFSTGYESEVLGRLISKGNNITDGIELMNDEVEGAYSLVILNDEELYVVRDPFGITPLSVGKNEEGYAVASESSALKEVGFKDFEDVKPGVILRLSPYGVEEVKELDSERHAHCAFEWGYTSRPDSIIEGKEVEQVRKRAGKYLAIDDVVGAEIAAAVPQSGIAYSLGYHQESGILYDEVFYLNRYSGRSYPPADPKIREQIAKEKLSVIKGNTKGKRIIIAEDSIVRGNQMLRIRDSLKKEGKAKEVHARVGCPPLRGPCPYTQTTKGYEELIYNRCDRDREKVSEKLNLDSLKYNSVKKFIEAIGLPEEELCLGCFTDKFPI